MNTPTAPQSPALPPPTLIGCPDSTLRTSALPGPDTIGFKAYNLARMAALGLPVPQAFVLGTQWQNAPASQLRQSWYSGLAALESATGLRFGDSRRPLLLSVRSGAPVSMPGMMETLLNIGLTEKTLPGLLRSTGNPRLVWDAYRRLIAGYGEVVLGLDSALFDADLQQVSKGRDERELDFSELRSLARLHLSTVQREAGKSFPQEPLEQLEHAIGAVFASWHAPKAQEYRRLHGLPQDMGTAVTVQRMVFGNAGGISGAGVGFSRHPSTGEAVPWVDFLFNAQGEDVVSGRRSARGHDELSRLAPAVWKELRHAIAKLEKAFGDMQDFEFTVENGQLWLLQTRDGKRTVQAQARIALDLWQEGLIDTAEARRRTAGLDADTLAVPRIVAQRSEGEADGQSSALAPVATGLSAAHGVASGAIALDEEQARRCHATHTPLLLVRHDAETSDIAALDIAQGLLTARGARTSHAAVVARHLGKVCLVDCQDLQIDLARRVIHLGGQPLPEGTVLTLDGNTGHIYVGTVKTVREVPAGILERLAQLRA